MKTKKDLLEVREPKRIGRPTKFSKALADRLCSRLAGGESLRSICKADDMPSVVTVMYWLLDADKEDFLKQYKAARDIQADLMADEMVDIADDGSNDYMERELNSGLTIEVVNSEHIQRSRLRVDTRKWVASKLKPKKYGDKLDLTSDGEKLPVPLLANVTLLDNNSNEESPSAQ